MTQQKFLENISILDNNLQKAVYKLVYSRGQAGISPTQLQDHLQKARVQASDLQLALKYLRQERYVFVRQTSVVATLFDPRAQNLDPWYEGLDKVDLVYLEKLRRCVLDTVRARRSPSA